MRVLIGAEHLGPSGGMERYVDVVAGELVSRGAMVRVLARRIDVAPAGVEAQQLDWAEEREAPDPRAARAVKAAIDAFAPDVAVAHNVLDSAVVRALRGAPRFAYHVHDHRPFCPNGDRVFPRSGRNCTERLGLPCRVHALTDGCAYGPRPRTNELIARRKRLRDAIAAADATIVASDYVAERAIGSGIPAARVAELPLPLPDEAYADHSTAPASRSVLFAARIVVQKGLISLVRALATIAPARRPVLAVLGTGPALGEARAEAARLDVALEESGAQGAPAVRAAIDRAALVVMPSLWAEPFGYVGIEAFARGRTVVAYDVGGVGAWLDDGVNGIAVPPRDEAALGAAIVRVLDDAPLREALQRRARSDAERFRAGPVTEELLNVYFDRRSRGA